MSNLRTSNEASDLTKFFDNTDAGGSIFKPGAENMVPAVINPTEFGPGLQLGTGLNAPALDVATPAVFTPAVAVVMSVPAMYSNNDNGVMGKIIKNLVECHAKSITSVDVEYTLNSESNSIVGHDSQNMSVPTKTVRNQQSPSMTMQELSGNIVYETFTKWMWDISHPDTYVSMAGLEFPGAWTMSAYTMSMMVIQFDPTMQPDRILSAAFFSNMFPTSVGSLGLERNLGTVKVPDRSITFAPAIVQHNQYIKEMAIEVAKILKMHSHDFNRAPAQFSEITKEIKDYGLQQEANARGQLSS